MLVLASPYPFSIIIIISVIKSHRFPHNFCGMRPDWGYQEVTHNTVEARGGLEYSGRRVTFIHRASPTRGAGVEPGSLE